MLFLTRMANLLFFSLSYHVGTFYKLLSRDDCFSEVYVDHVYIFLVYTAYSIFFFHTPSAFHSNIFGSLGGILLWPVAFTLSFRLLTSQDKVRWRTSVTSFGRSWAFFEATDPVDQHPSAQASFHLHFWQVWCSTFGTYRIMQLCLQTLPLDYSLTWLSSSVCPVLIFIVFHLSARLPFVGSELWLPCDIYPKSWDELMRSRDK